MNAELLAEIEQMSEEELTAIMETEFPEELEKQAAAQLAEDGLINALYAYGALSAERAFAEIEGDGDLSKVASAEEIESHENAEAEVGAIIEQAIAELGLAEVEDEVEMHKTAQACASIIFDGYTDTLEKIAKKGKAAAGVGVKLKELGTAVSAALSKKKNAAKKLIKDHAGKAGLIGGAALGAGAYKGYQMMDKRASDMTVGELAAAINGVNEIEAGIEKLAKKGSKKGASMLSNLMKSIGKGKDKVVDMATSGYKATKKSVKNNPGKYGLGAGLVAGAGGMYGADRLMKSKRSQE